MLQDHDLTRLRLTERRELLKSLVMIQDKRIRISDYVEAGATELLAAVREQHLEGIVGKRKDSPYQPGKRRGAWIKYRVNRGQELAIGCYTPGAHGIDAIIVGYQGDGGLIYVARIRNGFVPASRRAFRARKISQCCNYFPVRTNWMHWPWFLKPKLSHPPSLHRSLLVAGVKRNARNLSLTSPYPTIRP